MDSHCAGAKLLLGASLGERVPSLCLVLVSKDCPSLCHFRGYWEPPASEDRVLDEDGFSNGFSNGVDGGWGEDDYDEDSNCFGSGHIAKFHDDDIEYYDDDDDSCSDGEGILPDIANLVAGISNVKTLLLLQ
ncbi:hypothetical protein Bca4012_030049 [Brassica carinata]